MFAVCSIPQGGKWYPGNTFGPRFAEDGKQEVSAADKGCRVYLLDPLPVAVALYSGCTPGKHRAWFLPEDRHAASLVGLRGGGGTPGRSCIHVLMDPMLLCPVTPHRSLNSCQGVISEQDLLCSPETEILEGLSDQGVTQVRRITIKKDSSLFLTKHLILTFNCPKLPSTIKAGYLNCKVRPYIPNPLHCFQCQRFGHSQTSCHGQLTCSRCASVGHSSTACNLEPKCINCSQSHPSESKLCPKWKIEKQIQEIKTNKILYYVEARKLIVPQQSQTYAQVAKSSTISATTQTDEKITKIICPPLQCLKPICSANQIPSTSPSMPTISTSSSSTQAQLLPSTSSVTITLSSESQPPIPLTNSAPAISTSLSTPATSSLIHVICHFSFHF
ncbi:uncharacterized protein TNCV_1395541 [Trichonephila clavipes]|nr:uncharacterized protein TNCV_1395541 [Trichonephila clavipes]